uniref:GP-PDE domain-containing protein n=1 Tax=Timema monikensis TaxID=170555 RepID=A0A7R9HLV7_9NEOP|nr:unnamed protein product [Timema monikensis]
MSQTVAVVPGQRSRVQSPVLSTFICEAAGLERDQLGPERTNEILRLKSCGSGLEVEINGQSAYLVDYYTYNSRATDGDPPYHVGFSYLLPSVLRSSEGQVIVPITSVKHRPIGQLTVLTSLVLTSLVLTSLALTSLALTSLVLTSLVLTSLVITSLALTSLALTSTLRLRQDHSRSDSKPSTRRGFLGTLSEYPYRGTLLSGQLRLLHKFMSSVEYVVVRPIPDMDCDMSVSYSRVWKESWAGLDVGHRGSGTSFKGQPNQCAEIRENTIASLKKAASSGADLVEFDVQLSKDLVPVLYHDFHVCIAMKRKKQLEEPDMLELPLKDLTLNQLHLLKGEPVKFWEFPNFQNVLTLSDNSRKWEDKARQRDNVSNGCLVGMSASPVRVTHDLCVCLSQGNSTLSGLSKVFHFCQLSFCGVRLSPSHFAACVLRLAPLDHSAKLVSAFPRSAWPVYHLAERSSNRVFSNEDEDEHQPFPTLQQALETLDPHTGFNIEIKWNMQLQDGTYEVYHPFDLNMYLDTVLKVVLRHAGTRKIVFSCFHPDVCTMIRLKQNKYPVMFLTQGVTDKYPPYQDPRAQSIPMAVHHAKATDILGINVHTEDILRDPSQVKLVLDSGLILFCWGDDNNDMDTIQHLKKLGLHGIIYDKIDQVSRKEVKESIFLVEAREAQRELMKVAENPSDTPVTSVFPPMNYTFNLEAARESLKTMSTSSFLSDVRPDDHQERAPSNGNS